MVSTKFLHLSSCLSFTPRHGRWARKTDSCRLASSEPTFGAVQCPDQADTVHERRAQGSALEFQPFSFTRPGKAKQAQGCLSLVVLKQMVTKRLDSIEAKSACALFFFLPTKTMYSGSEIKGEQFSHSRMPRKQGQRHCCGWTLFSV